MKKIWFSIISICLLVGFTANAFAVAGFSEVNNELFDKAHLKNITQPTILHYKYERTSFVDGPREDTVDVVISNVRNTGRKDTHFEFFTGENNKPYQDRENQQGNGVFMYFLEYDVHELNRLTGGSWQYFQRKIRWALAKGADKKEIEIDYEGKKVKAVQYIIQPFMNDPKNSRYPLYASKYYIFTMSEAIPGEIYQVRTIVPDGNVWKEGDAVLTEETVTFSGFDNF